MEQHWRQHALMLIFYRFCHLHCDQGMCALY